MPRQGEQHHNARLPDWKVEEMRTLHDELGLGYRFLAWLYDVGDSTARDILTYRTRTAA